jgi:NAD(P)H-nitrite reductase large subunit
MPDPHVVIIGCGFGGLAAARAMAGAPVRVTLVDRSNHHLFQPLLYQVATAGLASVAIAAPIRYILRRQRNVTTLLAEVRAIDVSARSVTLDDGARLGYDYLIVAAGATHSYFGRDEWAALAPGLKTLDDALAISRRFRPTAGRCLASGRRQSRWAGAQRATSSRACAAPRARRSGTPTTARSRRSGATPRSGCSAAALLGVAGVAVLALPPHLLSHRLPQSPDGVGRLGVVVRDLRALGAHRARRRG